MKSTAGYRLDKDGAFIIDNFNAARPFSNFFPGIAGVWGIPMWVFYVNRGQGIASFGIESKDKAIMEFQPANKSYRLTSNEGFRTFLKIKKNGAEKFYEPFRNPASSPWKITQSMKTTSHDMTIEEVNSTLGLSVTVNYFTMPEEPFAALVRHVTIQNLSKSALSVEMVDGLPVIIPYGQNDWIMKNMCRTIEAWYKVRNLDRKAPYFQLNVEAADVPQVKHIKEGNFYFAFDPKAKAGALLEPLVEAANVFGQATDYSVAENFMGKFAPAKEPQTDNRTPSAMSFTKFSLQGNGVKDVVSVIGFARSVDELNDYVHKVTSKGFFEAKKARNREIIDEIKALAFTCSASTEFNDYSGQTFLDNVLRGGLPISLKTSEGEAVFNVYSRKHGDLERDYNLFKLSPTFLSQGNGNYRDVNQNRRNDVWFNPDVKESTVVNFFSLSQADGYNPLIVCGMMFMAEDPAKIESLVSQFIKGECPESFKTFLQKGFMPGDLFHFLAVNNIKLACSPMEFLAGVLGICQKYETAQHGEGFWSDHWAYNLDLVESYLAVYPENLKALLLDNKQFTFYHNAVYVLPREKRYVLTSRGVRQYASLHEGKEDKDRGHKLRIRYGEGEAYHTTLLVKLLCLIANKAATFDPSGIGIEMEANKPNWYDSLNGLPGLLGSSISETFELKRFSRFALRALNKLSISGDMPVNVYEELANFITELSSVIARNLDNVEYWKHANDIKERYRQSVRSGLSGVEKDIFIRDIRRFLEGVIAKVDRAQDFAKFKNGLFPTYFYHQVTHYEFVDERQAGREGAHVRPLEFKRHDLPFFLEGFVHALRSEQDQAKAREFYQKIKKSPLFDKELKMYKLNADITSESEEIGRTRVFPRGWLENESAWLHMEYKYLLELLRRGLCEEFYEDLATMCVAFMDPARYGRSVLENSSFIVSSAHKDKSLHGQGNVARLSGSTAEFIHIWMIMNIGTEPFHVKDNGELELSFNPMLKATFFTKKKSTVPYRSRAGKWENILVPQNAYAFNFMGQTLVVYHNPKRKDTFGKARAVIESIALHYSAKKIQQVKGGTVPAPWAEDVRSGKVERIDVYLC
ncbi:MAG: hypothetical protein HQL16_06180 [Candidatus Omnitrophica bacterium]|nr:hypothetical protein [Candidatus Omnitrophota bacterium]